MVSNLDGLLPARFLSGANGMGLTAMPKITDVVM